MKKSRENVDIMAADVRERIHSYLTNTYRLSEEEVEERLKNWTDTQLWNEADSRELMQVGILDCLIKYRDLSLLADAIELDAIDKLVLDFGSKFVALGGLSSLGDMDYCSSQQKVVEQVVLRHEVVKEIPRINSRRATNKRYEESRRLKKELGALARNLWENGSNIKHNKMKDHLLKIHVDADDNHPFGSLKEKPVLALLKNVLREIGREDLIYGYTIK